MRKIICIVIILLNLSVNISFAFENASQAIFDFNDSDNLLGWSLLSYDNEKKAMTIIIDQNLIINVKNKNDQLGRIRFDYYAIGDFASSSKLILSVDKKERELNVSKYNEYYVIDVPNGDISTPNSNHTISWLFSCPNCPPNLKDKPRCIIDNVVLENLEMFNTISKSEIILNPSEKDLNNKINQSHIKRIALDEGVHIGSITIEGAHDIELEPIKDATTHKYVDVIFDGNNTSYALKLKDAIGVTIKGFSLRNALNALIIENCSDCIIGELNIADYKENGILISNCINPNNNINNNIIRSYNQSSNEGIPFNIENSNNTCIFLNKIENPNKHYDYILNNSYYNNIIIPSSGLDCQAPICSNGINCLLASSSDCYNYYDIAGDDYDTCDVSSSEKILQNRIAKA